MSRPLTNLIAIVAKLRAPDGCPWDKKQTHDSLKPYLLEEAYELLEAIDGDDTAALKEELGDVLLQVLLHAHIASEDRRFTIDEVADGLSDKLVRRHPHVFAADELEHQPNTPEDVALTWETIKQRERAQKDEPPSALDGIPAALPALHRAQQVQKRAARSGFDWKTISPVVEKLREECDELLEAAARLAESEDTDNHDTRSDSQRQADVEAEFGDVLFSFVNLARFLRLNPEDALRRTTNRFASRFQYIEARAREQGKDVKDYSESELDVWWNEAKRQERDSGRQLAEPTEFPLQ